MWRMTEYGASNGIDQAIVIRVELVEKFDVFWLRKVDDRSEETPLKWYLSKSEAKDFVRRLVKCLNESSMKNKQVI